MRVICLLLMFNLAGWPARSWAFECDGPVAVEKAEQAAILIEELNSGEPLGTSILGSSAEGSVGVFLVAVDLPHGGRRIYRVSVAECEVIGVVRLTEAETSVVNESIVAFAEEMGEYFEPTEETTRIVFSRLPEGVRETAKRELRHRKELLHVYGDAEIGDAYTLSLQAKQVGYIVRIDDRIDHGLWDGSGVTLYISWTGQLVLSVEWTG